MADILSQEEVDLLLNAVSKGDVEVEEAHYEPVETRDLVTHDFRRPEQRISKDQLKGLQSLFEAFARELSISLPPFLRTVVRVDLLSLDHLTYDEFILSVSRPTCLTVINMEPLEGQSVIELSPSVVFPIVDRILGGRGQMISQARELTEIENRIVHRIILIILESLRRSWEQLIEFRLTVQSQESDPLIVQIVPGSDMVILVGYEMHVGEITGNMNLCIPLIYLNPVLDQISQQTRFMRRMNTRLAQQTKTRLQRVVRQASVPVDAVLGTAQLNVSDLATLEVGDVIPLDSNADGSIPVEISGLARFLARPGKVREQSAVQVERLIGEE